MAGHAGKYPLKSSALPLYLTKESLSRSDRYVGAKWSLIGLLARGVRGSVGLSEQPQVLVCLLLWEILALDHCQWGLLAGLCPVAVRVELLAKFPSPLAVNQLCFPHAA